MSPVTLSFVVIVSIFASTVRSSDPDPIADYFVGPNPTVSSFTLRDVFTNGDLTVGPGGVRSGLNTSILPGIRNQGLTYVHFRLFPCGVNLPHTHPRATELLTLINGTVQAGFIDTAGNAFVTTLNPGDIIVFPRALTHFEINTGTQDAFFVSALNSENPGVMGMVAMFNLPIQTFATITKLNLNTARAFQQNGKPYTAALQLAPPSVCTPGTDPLL